MIGSAVSLFLLSLVLLALGWMLLSPDANTKPITKRPTELAMEGRRLTSHLNAKSRVATEDDHDDSVYDVWDFRRRAEEGAQD